jgi:hypothetical protein
VLIALFHGFVLQQAWDKSVQLDTYRAVVDAALNAILLGNHDGR